MGEAGSVGAPWPRRAASSSRPAVGEGKATVWPSSPGVATHPCPLQGDGMPAAPSQFRSRAGTLGPRAPVVPACFLVRVLPEPGSLGATTWTVQGCPVSQPLCAQETPILRQLHKRKAYSGPSLGSPKVSLGLSMDRALQGLRTGHCTHRPGG